MQTKSLYKPKNAAQVFVEMFLPKFGNIREFSRQSGIAYKKIEHFIKDANTIDEDLDKELCIFLDISIGTILKCQRYYIEQTIKMRKPHDVFGDIVR